MKNIFSLFIATIVISGAANAQTRIGFNAGSTLANITSKTDGEKEVLSYKAGITAGVFADFSFTPKLSFQPAINFTQKGATQSESGLDATISLNYLEVPLNFVYSSGAETGFFVGAGPALSYGMSGKIKFTFMGETESEKLKFGNDKDFKSFDLAANILAGYKFSKGFMFSAGYNLGLANISTEEGTTGKNNYFSIKIGFMLPSSK